VNIFLIILLKVVALVLYVATIVWWTKDFQ